MSAALMTRCVNAHDRCYGSGRCEYCEPVTPLRTEDGRFAAIVHDFAERVACEECGEDCAELRRYPFHGWIPDAIWCRECFAEHDTENSFTDFPIIQEAMAHA